MFTPASGDTRSTIDLVMIHADLPRQKSQSTGRQNLAICKRPTRISLAW